MNIAAVLLAVALLALAPISHAESDRCGGLASAIADLAASRDGGHTAPQAIEKVLAGLNPEAQSRARSDLGPMAAFVYEQPQLSKESLVPYFYGVCMSGGLDERASAFEAARASLGKSILACQQNNPSGPSFNNPLTACVFSQVKAALP